jgi:hypothetical protein
MEIRAQIRRASLDLLGESPEIDKDEEGVEKQEEESPAFKSGLFKEAKRH